MRRLLVIVVSISLAAGCRSKPTPSTPATPPEKSKVSVKQPPASVPAVPARPTGNPQPPAAAAELCAGRRHTCVRLSSGAVHCWGENSQGQLGDGTTDKSSQRHMGDLPPAGRARPVAVALPRPARQIACGEEHSCARLADGTVQCWGDNEEGQLGDGSNTDRNRPVAVRGLAGATAIALGQSHGCALLKDGTMRCWGAGSMGQLGIGSEEAHTAPVQVQQLPGKVIDLAAGGLTTCARLVKDALRCWGERPSESPMAKTRITWPGRIKGAERAKRMSLGFRHLCFLLEQGWHCMGDNLKGEVADSTTKKRLVPTPVQKIEGIADLVAGFYGTCARMSDRTVRCWGPVPPNHVKDPAKMTQAERAELLVRFGGHMMGEPADLPPAPWPVPGLAAVVQLVLGEDFGCALVEGGRVDCWGHGFGGQLGDGTRIYRPTAGPVRWP